MDPASGALCDRPEACSKRVMARAVIERQLGRSFGCRALPPRRHRLFAMLLLVTGAYCLLLHQQEERGQPSPVHLALSSHGNRSRALTAFGGDPLASTKRGTGAEGASGAAPDGVTREESRDSEMEEELERRRKRVWEACKANGLVGKKGAGEPNAWEFFIDDKHHLVWCNIFKAASSSWMYNFNLLGGYTEQYLRRSKKMPLTIARERFPRPSVKQLREALPRSLSFLIVRDPFERLLSAYRNKIEGSRHKFYRKMARKMISRFRVTTSLAPGIHRASSTTLASLNSDLSPTFSEFVSWVIASARKAAGAKGRIGAPGFDEHWAPYFRFCTPCAVNFTVVAKMETLARDEEYVIRKTGIGPALGSTGKTREGETARPSVAVNAAIGGRTEDVLPQYFRSLSMSQLEALYDIYRIDFQMFGYDASKYFDMVSS